MDRKTEERKARLAAAAADVEAQKQHTIHIYLDTTTVEGGGPGVSMQEGVEGRRVLVDGVAYVPQPPPVYKPAGGR